jgi:hypothetical protein
MNCYETKPWGKEQYHNNFGCYSFVARSGFSCPMPTFRKIAKAEKAQIETTASGAEATKHQAEIETGTSEFAKENLWKPKEKLQRKL